MKIRTTSGELSGLLIEFVGSADDNGRDGLDGYVLIKRDSAPASDRPYSTHYFYTDPDGNQYSQEGHYDMTLEEARESMRHRTEWS